MAQGVNSEWMDDFEAACEPGSRYPDPPPDPRGPMYDDEYGRAGEGAPGRRYYEEVNRGR